MTLVIGILCDRGVVLAADAMATLGFVGEPVTIGERMEKLILIAGRVILGVSGPVGLGQRFEDEVRRLYREGCFKSPGDRPLTSVQAMVKVGEALKKHIEPALRTARLSIGLVSDPAASVRSRTVLAMPIGGKPCLCEFDMHGEPELKSSALPFACVGSGRPTADPFIAFLRKFFWKQTELPKLSAATLVAIWALRHALETSPGWLSEPLQVAVLEQHKRNQWRARELTEAEMGEHLQVCDDAEEALRSFTDGLRFGEGVAPSEIPVPQ